MTLQLQALDVPGTRRNALDGLVGSHVQEALTWEDVCEMADLDWAVAERPLYYRTGEKTVRLLGRKATVRNDNGAFLGDVGINYAPINNKDVAPFTTELVKNGDAKFLKAGHYDLNGAKGFATIALGENIELQLPADGNYITENFSPWLVLTWSHDGSDPVRGSLVVMRLICTNGLTLPVAARHFAIRHTGDVERKLVVAQETMATWLNYKERWERAVARLAAKRMSWAEIEAFTKKLFPSAREQKEDGEAAAITQARRDALLTVLRRAPDLAGFQNSGWGVYNAVAEYADHVVQYPDSANMRRGVERRFRSILWDNAAELKDRAYAILTR